MSLLHQIALTKVSGVGPTVTRHLLSHLGSAEAIFSATKKQLLTIPYIRETIAEAIKSKNALQFAESELSFIEKHDIQALFFLEENYPKRLRQCPDAPLLLYFKGNADLDSKRVVSVVGTRNATSYGVSLCQEFVKALKPHNALVVSGLAHGIDSQAHRTAVANDIPTVGVLGHGLDRIYPAANRDMAAQMLDNGGLLTEFPSNTIPERTNFPMRNRIIAGLADVTIVVEAATKGGALITAEIANSYNRDVCAFPGNTQQEYSAGCNYLIKTHRAHLIHDITDLEYLMDWTITEPSKSTGKQLSLHVSLDATEQKVYDIIRQAEPIAIDDLSIQLEWPQSKLAMTLLQLEIKGAIVALPGKVYKGL